MPIVTVKPNNQAAEALLVELAPRLLPDLKSCVCLYWGVAESDVIVRVQRCDIIVDDPTSSDADVWVETNPNPRLEALADTLRDMLVAYWAKCTDSRLNAEFWVRFVAGSWCVTAKDTGEIADREDMHHKPPRATSTSPSG
jgi:hypothetical protein